jgi:GAF domain-containing protein
MAGPGRTGGKRSAAKTRKASSARGRSSAKTKRPVGPAIRLKRSTASGKELKAAREQQAATAEILKVIASSPEDVQPAFDAIAERSKRLVDARSTTVFTLVDGVMHLRAFTPTNSQADATLQATFPAPLSSFSWGESILRGDIYRVVDADKEQGVRNLARLRGFRSMLLVPLLRDGRSIGLISVTRVKPGPFADHHVELLQTFADQAVIAIENARLFNETKEALERQTATAEILKVISRSTNDLAPVLDAIAETAAHLCGADFAFVYKLDADMFHLAASNNANADWVQYVRDHPVGPGRATVVGRTLLERRTVHVKDVLADREYTDVQRQRLGNYRTILGVPLLRDQTPIGSIILLRSAVKPFSIAQINLVETFADQAVIAVENVRLFDEVQARTLELTDSLEQQTATSEVLSVISSSAGDLVPVFDAMLSKAMQLCSANFGVLNSYDGKAFHTAATYGLPPAYDEYRRKQPQEYGLGTAPARLLQGEPVVEFTDLLESEAYRNGEPNRRALVDIGGARCLLAVPLLKDERVVGNVMIFRQDKRPFSEKQIALLQQFAAQAVIAIENTRLLRELRESTEDLSESLQQQTATADLLQVISRSAFDLQPIFDAIAERAVTLCGADRAFIFRFDGELLNMVAAYNAPPDFKEWVAQHPIRPGLHSGSARAALERRTIHIHDVRADPEYTYGAKDAEDIRTVLGVPILKGDELLGVMMIYHLEGVRPFTEKQIALVETFADQAAIAIENVRLFDELRQRTDDLAESLQQQTATADVLKVISRSAFDLDSVLATLLTSAARLCEAEKGVIFLRKENHFHMVSNYGFSAEFEAFARTHPYPVDSGSTTTRSAASGTAVHVADVLADETQSDLARQYQRLGGHRTIIGVPLRRDDEIIGVFTLTRQVVRPFTNRQIELVETFADQAVIAIENARLFNETREALERQTATADILKVIASSPSDVQPVFNAIASSANALLGGLSTAVHILTDDTLHLMAFTPTNPAGDANLQAAYPRPLSALPWGAQLREGEIVLVGDTELEWAALPAFRDVARMRGFRSILRVPLLRDGTTIGAINVTRTEPGQFAEHHVQLLQTFADQAVIAISNVRLFQQVQERTRELSASLDDLSAAQDRLIQTEKLASLGQLTAGIAHEIKNPLNFVNNFSALSAELVDEMTEVFENPALDEASRRKELDEIRDLLKSNLEKVVQHGKRADSIVKNMLLHSREGSGEHRATEVNALVDESLNLAYHGARAERPNFNVTLQRDFDPQAGTVEVFPQEINRVLLNLISNGFYAVTKRKDNGGEDFEALVTAITRGRDDHVEIRIRDNGTGIPPEVKDKMFNPFFTTKPAGEGTGLGLSMSHDIIVKQHGGTIDVLTEPGAFTEFIITLQRKAKKMPGETK